MPQTIKYICRELVSDDKTAIVSFYIKDVLENVSKDKLSVSWHPTECIGETFEIIKAVYEDEIEHEEKLGGKQLLHWKNCVINKEDIIEQEKPKQPKPEHTKSQEKKILTSIEKQIKTNIELHLSELNIEKWVDEGKKWCKTLSQEIKNCALEIYNDYKNDELKYDFDEEYELYENDDIMTGYTKDICNKIEKEEEKKKLLKELEDECRLNILGYLKDIDSDISEAKVKKWYKKLEKEIAKCAVDMYNDHQSGNFPDFPSDLRKREGDLIREYMQDTIFPQLPQEE